MYFNVFIVYVNVFECIYVFNIYIYGVFQCIIMYLGTSTSQGAKCAHLVSTYQGPLGNNSLYYIDFRQRNLHNL
jgi:hypothetical protein